MQHEFVRFLVPCNTNNVYKLKTKKSREVFQKPRSVSRSREVFENPEKCLMIPRSVFLNSEKSAVFFKKSAVFFKKSAVFFKKSAAFSQEERSVFSRRAQRFSRREVFSKKSTAFFKKSAVFFKKSAAFFKKSAVFFVKRTVSLQGHRTDYLNLQLLMFWYFSKYQKQFLLLPD